MRLARSAPGRYDVLATGPLTNLGLALILEPELPSLVRSVVIMGGSAAYGGNMSSVAEANIWHDPEAAKLVFDAAWPITMAGLDVTMRTMLDEAAIARIAEGTSSHARFATAILRHYLGFYEMITGRRACPLHDPTAAAVLADPTLITRALDGDVTVATGDDARGQTIVDRRKDGEPWQAAQAGPRTIVMEIDGQRFVDDLVETLLRGGERWVEAYGPPWSVVRRVPVVRRRDVHDVETGAAGRAHGVGAAVAHAHDRRVLAVPVVDLDDRVERDPGARVVAVADEDRVGEARRVDRAGSHPRSGRRARAGRCPPSRRAR